MAVTPNAPTMHEHIDRVLVVKQAQHEALVESQGDCRLHALVSYGYESDEAVSLEAATPEAALTLNDSGMSALHYSVTQLYFHGVECIASVPGAVDTIGQQGISALHIAAVLDQFAPDICSILLDNGASLQNGDTFGLTPLHYAATAGVPDVVALFCMNATMGPETWTQCMQLALSAGNYACVSQLVVSNMGIPACDSYIATFLDKLPAPVPASLSAVIKVFRSHLDNKSEIIQWKEAAVKYKKEYLEAQEQFSHRTENLEHELAAQQDRVQTVQAQLHSAQREHESLSVAVEDKQSQLVALKAKLEHTAKQNLQLQQVIGSKTAELAEFISVSKQLHAQNQTLQSELLKANDLARSFRERNLCLEKLSAKSARCVELVISTIDQELVEQAAGTIVREIMPRAQEEQATTSTSSNSSTTNGFEDPEEYSSASDADSLAEEEHKDSSGTEDLTSSLPDLTEAQQTLASSDLPYPWSAGYDADGQFYFYNEETNESCWEMPPQLAQDLEDESRSVTAAETMIIPDRTMDVWATFFERLAARSGFAEDDLSQLGGAAAGQQLASNFDAADLMQEAMEQFISHVQNDEVEDALDVWVDHSLPPPHLCLQPAEEGGISVLHIAAWNNSREMMKMLLNCESTADAQCLDALGNTPLHVAAMAGSSAAIEVILQTSPVHSLHNSSGQTPLSLAVQALDKSCVELLASALFESKTLEHCERVADFNQSLEDLRDAQSQATVARSSTDNPEDDANLEKIQGCIAILCQYLKLSQIQQVDSEPPTPALTRSESGFSDSTMTTPRAKTASTASTPPIKTQAPPSLDVVSSTSMWSKLRQAFGAAREEAEGTTAEWEPDDEAEVDTAPPIVHSSGVGIQSPGLSVFKKKRGSVYKRVADSALNTPGSVSRRASLEDSPRLTASKLSYESSTASSVGGAADSATPPPLPGDGVATPPPPPAVAFLQPTQLPGTSEQKPVNVAVTGRYVNTFARD